MATRDPERYFDRRTIKRHLKRGVVSEADFDSYVESLPDVSDKIKPRDEGGDDDGFDGRGRPKTPAQTSEPLAMPEPRVVSDENLDDVTSDDVGNISADISSVSADISSVSADISSFGTVSADTGSVSADTSSVSADTSPVSAVTSPVSADTSSVSADTSSVSPVTSPVSADTSSVSDDTDSDSDDGEGRGPADLG